MRRRIFAKRAVGFGTLSASAGLAGRGLLQAAGAQHYDRAGAAAMPLLRGRYQPGRTPNEYQGYV
jgi:hypothetical protein